MDRSSRIKFILLLSAGAFFCAAPFWVLPLQKLMSRGLYITPDSMVLLGVTLLVSLLAYYLLPDFLVTRPLTPGVRFTSEVKVSAKGRIRPTLFGERGSEVTPRRWSCLWMVAVSLTLLALVYGLYLVNQRILHSFLSSADEHSCYFLAECLRKGKLYVEIPPLADFFKVVHVGMKGGKWFSVYPPGWPLVWALGLQFNIVDWLNPVMSAIAVFLFFLSGKRLFGIASSVVGLLICVLSPFFMFTAASYFSHATCLLCISVFLYAFLKWRESHEAGKDPVGWAALCSFAVGYGLMTRYLTMAAVAAPFLLYHYLPIFFDWRGWGKGTWGFPFSFKVPRLKKSDWIVIVIMGLFMAVILWQNYLVTGKPFKAPNKYDKSWERLGFRKDYTVVDAFFYLIARVFYLMDWFAPAIVAAYLVLLFNLRHLRGEISGPRPPEILGRIRPQAGSHTSEILKTLFRLTPVFIAFAYFFYYSWGGNQWGPRYLWEGMPFLCIAVVDWIISLWRKKGTGARKFLLAFVAVSLVTSVVLFFKHAEFTGEASRQRRALYDLAETTIQGPAIVFIHGFLGDRLVLAEEDAVRNSPFLDSRILYAHDLGDRNNELMAVYPGRSYYRGTYDRQRMTAVLIPSENMRP